MERFSFSNPHNTDRLWDEVLAPQWQHRGRPQGKRFLGSINLSRAESDALIDLVAWNLQGVEPFTWNALLESFSAKRSNWLKIVMVALSEYAYYYSGSGEHFWEGLCAKLGIPPRQSVIATLTKVTQEGIWLLSLVETQGGYRHISQLWLQSGIPQQNLRHFAELVRALALKYGWWELSQVPEADLSRELLKVWEETGRQWGTIYHFLDASCPTDENPDREPISGQLVKGIAYLARELEHNQLAPEILLDAVQRERVLKGYYLPQNFFLRDWSHFIEVLRPVSTPTSRGRRIRGLGKKAVSLQLDAENLCVQLVFPEQELWRPEWQSFEGYYCALSEFGWEGIVPEGGPLVIPEQATPIKRLEAGAKCQLLNHNGAPLLDWSLPQVDDHFPVVVFDALTGVPIVLDPAAPVISTTDEIYLFAPRSSLIEADTGIEVMDDRVPISFQGLKCRSIRLLEDRSELKLELQDRTVTIAWGMISEEAPQMRGLRLPGRKPIYAEPPQIWLPPRETTSVINLSIESVDTHAFVFQGPLSWPAGDEWFRVPLTQWLTNDGGYIVHLWGEHESHSETFTLQTGALSAPVPQTDVRVRAHLAATCPLPYHFDHAESFWTERFSIEGLWPFEPVDFSLSEALSPVPLTYRIVADAHGTVSLDVGRFQDLLANTSHYQLTFRRLGHPPVTLAVLGQAKHAIDWGWGETTLALSGIQRERLYTLSAWNLLAPLTPALRLSVPRPASDSTEVEITLEVPPGLYFMQLSSGQLPPVTLGWWASPDIYDLPPEAADDDTLSNFCYAILDDEPAAEFRRLAYELGVSLSDERAKLLIQSLTEAPSRLPSRLPAKRLGVKVDLLRISATAVVAQASVGPSAFSAPATPSTTSTPPVEATRRIPVAPPKPRPAPSGPTSQWYMLTLPQAPARLRQQKRQTVQRMIELSLKQRQLTSIVTSVILPEFYEEIVLIKTSDIKRLYPVLEQIDGIARIEKNPLKPEAVVKFAGSQAHALE